MPKNPGPEQESFFAIGRDTGDMVLRQDLEADPSSPSVGIVERAIHLHNTLGLFTEVNIRRGLVDDLSRTRPEVLQRRYGQNANAVVAGAEANADRFYKESKWEFARAFGFFSLEQSGLVPIDRLKQGAARSFQQLWQAYGSRHQVQARLRKRTQLERIVDSYQTAFTERNRAEGIRPHQELVEAAKPEDRQLDTQARLQAIHDDPRAGFLPTTHLEKNTVLAFLDYQDNPDYQLGIRNQFLEIARSNIRRFPGRTGVEYGNRAPISITYELADYLSNADRQLAALRELEVLIADCPNPRVTLAEEIGAEHPGYAPLIRFMDLSELRVTGKVKGLPRDPLRTYRNETDVEPELQGKKNKVEEDQYTRKELRPVFAKRIAKKPTILTIGELRQTISDAIANEDRRAFYMRARLMELDAPAQALVLQRTAAVARFALDRLAS